VKNQSTEIELYIQLSLTKKAAVSFGQISKPSPKMILRFSKTGT